MACENSVILNHPDTGQASFEIVFLGKECLNGKQIWRYTVEQLVDSPDLSNWAIELCFDPPQFVAIDESGNPETTQPDGLMTFAVDDEGDVDYSPEPCIGDKDSARAIKWERTGDDYEKNIPYPYSFTLVGCFEEGEVKVAVKAGSNSQGGCYLDDICGPICTKEPGRGVEIF